MPRGNFTDIQLSNIRKELTIYPKKTTDIGSKEPPKPIRMYADDEVNNLIGVPRGYYISRRSSVHEETVDITYGAPMRDLTTKFRAEGPYAEQAKCLQVMKDSLEGEAWGGVLLRADPGFGKALAHGEPVLTKDGYIPIEDISVGDMVAGTDGNFYPVTGVYPQGERELFRVTFTDGTHVDCDGDHLWTFVRGGRETVTIKTRMLMVSVWTLMYRLPRVTGKSASRDRYVMSVVSRRQKGLATCISVDSPDHLFLTRNGVPTHNTIVSVEFARRLGRRTLILVHKDFLVRQWKARIKAMMPDAVVGIIRQQTCEYDLTKDGRKPDFVIALMQSLAKDTGGKYPQDMYNSAFGLVVVDECHRVAAHSFSGIMPRFKSAWRLGVSATPRRKDGAQDVFFKHISKITYSASTKMMTPRLRRVITDTTLRPISRGRYRVSVGDLNSAQVLTQLGTDKFRNRQIVEDLMNAVKAKRKILVVSERLEQLKMLADDLGRVLFSHDLGFPVRLDFYTGQWYTGEKWEKKTGKHKAGDLKMRTRTEAELERAETANVMFATKQIVHEGMDVTALDVLFFATPMSDIEQVVGRVQRWCFPEEKKCERLCPWRAGECKGKPDPIIVDVVDENVSPLKRKFQRRMKFYEKIGAVKRR